jgi:type IV pilus assembly protein PilO
VATIVLGVRVALDWQATSSGSVDAMAGRQAELRALELQTAPLRGLDAKVAESSKQIDAFYEKRIPASWSVLLEQLGDLKTKAAVQLTRAQYVREPGSGDLTEIRIDAGLSGDYGAVMRFINGLERSQIFFVIRAMALTGEQSGTVNLRMQFSTWMRPAAAEAGGAPLDTAPNKTEPQTPEADSQKPGPAGTSALRREQARAAVSPGEGE